MRIFFCSHMTFNHIRHFPIHSSIESGVAINVIGVMQTIYDEQSLPKKIRFTIQGIIQHIAGIIIADNFWWILPTCKHNVKEGLRRFANIKAKPRHSLCLRQKMKKFPNTIFCCIQNFYCLPHGTSAISALV